MDDPLYIGIRFALYADLMLLFGLPLFALYTTSAQDSVPPRRPILILNIKNFWDPLCALLDHMRRLEFIRADLAVALLVAERPEDVLPKLRAAAAEVSERAKQGEPETVERM